MHPNVTLEVAVEQEKERLEMEEVTEEAEGYQILRQPARHSTDRGGTSRTRAAALTAAPLLRRLTSAVRRPPPPLA